MALVTISMWCTAVCVASDLNKLYRLYRVYLITVATIISNYSNAHSPRLFPFQLAEALLEKETLDYDEVVELIGPPPHEIGKRQVDSVEFEQSLKNLGSADTDNPKA